MRCIGEDARLSARQPPLHRRLVTAPTFLDFLALNAGAVQHPIMDEFEIESTHPRQSFPRFRAESVRRRVCADVHVCATGVCLCVCAALVVRACACARGLIPGDGRTRATDGWADGRMQRQGLREHDPATVAATVYVWKRVCWEDAPRRVEWSRAE